MNSHKNRREFLQLTSASVLAATTLRSSPAIGNDPKGKLTVGLIGCGGRGLHDARLFKSNANVEIAYVCDPDQGRLANVAKSLEVPASRAVADLRRMLDDKSLEAVIVGTSDHWHSPASILACEAGKHVYVDWFVSDVTWFKGS